MATAAQKAQIAKLEANVKAEQAKVAAAEKIALAAEQKSIAATVKMDPNYGVEIAQAKKDAAAPGSAAYIAATRELTDAKNVASGVTQQRDTLRERIAAGPITPTNTFVAPVNTGTDSLANAAIYAADQETAREKARVQSERVSAYALLESEFTKYGLGALAKTVKQLILDGASSSEMTIKLRNTPEYQVRFAGNTQRLKEGKNVYDEATYLALENSMQQAFTAYGVNSLLGDTREKQQAKLSTFIGGDISPTEVKNRIQLAVEEVSNRPDILSAFQEYYPQVSSNDLVSYFLDPKETTTRLTTKIKASQIGAAAMRQGFVSNVLNSEELAALGVTEEQAVTGYKNVAAVLPEAEKLSAIENTGYSASEAEGAYLRNLESEQRKLRKLAERESARFSGRSGVNQTSLKDVKSAGQF
jgi:hypothetical protein